jgi:hypothetical protein
MGFFGVPSQQDLLRKLGTMNPVRMTVHAATSKPVKAVRRAMFGIAHPFETVESAPPSNPSLRILVPKRGQKCDVASQFGGFWKAKTLVVHRDICVRGAPARREIP